MIKKKAILLAGGRGTRLHPYTISTPKPMVPIGELPILEIVIKKLKKHKFTSITISVNYQANIIMDYFEDGKKWDVEIDYVIENNPLGTMGPLNLIDNLPNDFLVMNGDVITDLNFHNLLNYHVDSKNIFTISSYKRTELIDYGVLECNKKNILVNFSEKPVKNYLVSMGIYIVNKSIIKYISKNKLFGFDHLMHKCLKNNIRVNIKNHNGYWLDVGRPNDYSEALKDIDYIYKKII